MLKSNSQQNKFLSLFVFSPFFFLFLLYSTIAVLSFKAWKRVKKMKTSQRAGRLFYLITLIDSIILQTCCLIMCILAIISSENSETKDNTNFYNVLTVLSQIPSIIFFMLFVVYFCQLAGILIHSRLEGNLKISIKIRSKKMFIFKIITILEIIFFIISSLLYIFNVINPSIYNVLDGLNSLVPPILIIIAQIILNYKLSGLPYKSILDRKKKNDVNLVLFYWILIRIMHGCFAIAIFFATFDIDPDSISKEIDDNDIFYGLLYVVLDKMLAEQLPLIFILRKSFIESFFSFDILELQQSYNKNKSEILNIDEDLTYLNKEKDDESSYNYFITKFDLIVPRENFSLNENSKVLKKKKGLGTLLCLKEKTNFPIIIRKINVKISKFIIEDVHDEIKKLRNCLTIQKISCFPFAYNYDDNHECLFIFYPFYEESSLKTLLQTDIEDMKGNKVLALNLKIKIALEILESLEILHENQIFHGHLNPNNIFLDNDFRVKLADFSFKSLEKLCGFKINYENKNQYVAPEILNEKGLIAAEATAKADIYSFGIILWEIFTEKIAFKNIQTNNLKKLIFEEENRPKIPEKFNLQLAHLIRVCWQANPNLRPEINTIKPILKSLKK